MTGDMANDHGCNGLVECSGNNKSGDVIDRNHVNGIDYVGSGTDLYATLEHTDEEVVSVRSCLS
jgi:hypothetical protein